MSKIPTVFFNPRGPLMANALLKAWREGRINLLVPQLEAPTQSRPILAKPAKNEQKTP